MTHRRVVLICLSLSYMIIITSSTMMFLFLHWLPSKSNAMFRMRRKRGRCWIYGLTRGRHIIWIMLNRIVKKCDRNFVCCASERPKDESINLSSTSEKEESESSSNRLLWCVRTSKIATLITTSFSESDKNKNVLKITWYFDCAEY